MKNYLITGAAGFIGSHLAEELVSNGHNVVGIDNLSSGFVKNLSNVLNADRFRFYQIDCRNSTELASIFEEITFDAVWHLASNTDIIGSHRDPRRDLVDSVEALVNILELVRKFQSKKLIFTSSGAIYGRTAERKRVSEIELHLDPTSSYGVSKLMSEKVVQLYCDLYALNAITFRFGNVIGRRLRHGVIYDFIQRLGQDQSRLVILGNGNQEKNYFHVSQCISAMLFAEKRLINKKGHAIFNLGANDTCNVKDIAAEVIDALGLNNVEVSVDGAELAWPGDQPIVFLDTTKIKSLGWTCSESSRFAIRRSAIEMMQE